MEEERPVVVVVTEEEVERMMAPAPGEDVVVEVEVEGVMVVVREPDFSSSILIKLFEDDRPLHTASANFPAAFLLIIEVPFKDNKGLSGKPS